MKKQLRRNYANIKIHEATTSTNMDRNKSLEKTEMGFKIKPNLMDRNKLSIAGRMEQVSRTTKMDKCTSHDHQYETAETTNIDL